MEYQHCWLEGSGLAMDGVEWNGTPLHSMERAEDLTPWSLGNFMESMNSME